jgi:hypothetical protein
MRRALLRQQDNGNELPTFRSGLSSVEGVHSITPLVEPDIVSAAEG